jgi:hypothetical protein
LIASPPTLKILPRRVNKQNYPKNVKYGKKFPPPKTGATTLVPTTFHLIPQIIIPEGAELTPPLLFGIKLILKVAVLTILI